jgi:hypothetical protein
MKSEIEIKVQRLCDTSHCLHEISRGGCSIHQYTILDGSGKRLSVTRPSEEKAWEDAFDRLTDVKPKLEEWQ